MIPRTFRTDALARVLALTHYRIVIRPEPTLTADEIETETARLNALPKDQQTVIFCQSIGISVTDFLMDRAQWNGQVLNDNEWLTLGDQ